MRFLIPILSFSFFLHFAQAKPKVESSTFASEGQKIKFETILDQKKVIWGFDFLPDRKIIFTTRDGSIMIFDPVKKSVINITGAPKVWAHGQGGLLDIRVHPQVGNKIYITYSDQIGKKAATSVGVGTLNGNKLVGFKKIFTGNNLNDEKIQFGSRIEFDGEGHIFVTIGDRDDRDRAQDLEFHNGKIIRINEDGSIPADNPFIKTKNAKSEIWSYGLRNPEGLSRDPKSGDLWSSDMGPRGGDELNLIKTGANYGWPVITYGREYYGPKIGEGTAKEGMEQPIAHWVPSISPSGIAVYRGDVFPNWKGNIFLGALSGAHLRRVVLEGHKVTKQEELLKDLDLRIRNVRTGPDGYLYLSTDSGLIARLVPSP